MDNWIDELRYVDWFDVIMKCVVGLLLVVCIGLVGGLIGDFIFWHEVEISGEVVGTTYTPSSVNTGSGVMSNGKVGVVTTVSSEKHSIAIRTADGVDEYDVDTDTYYSYVMGDYAHLTCRVGNILGLRLGCSKRSR